MCPCLSILYKINWTVPKSISNLLLFMLYCKKHANLKLLFIINIVHFSVCDTKLMKLVFWIFNTHKNVVRHLCSAFYPLENKLNCTKMYLKFTFIAFLYKKNYETKNKKFSININYF